MANAIRHGDPDKILAAKRAFWAQRAEDVIGELLGKAPPLTSPQLDRLAAILDSAPRADAC